MWHCHLILRRWVIIIGVAHVTGAVFMLLDVAPVFSAGWFVILPLPTAVVFGRRLHAVDAILATFIVTGMTWVALVSVKRELTLVFWYTSPLLFSEMVVGALIGAALRYAA